MTEAVVKVPGLLPKGRKRWYVRQASVALFLATPDEKTGELPQETNRKGRRDMARATRRGGR